MNIEKKLEKKLAQCQYERNEWRDKFTKLTYLSEHNPKHDWYIRYLMDEIRTLEECFDKLDGSFHDLLEHAQKQQHLLDTFTVISSQDKL